MPTVGSLATLVGGEVVGDASLSIRGLAPLDTAQSDQVSFLSNGRYRDALAETRAGAVLVRNADRHVHVPNALIVCDDPYLAMAKLAAHLHAPPRPSAGVHPRASVHESATLAASASIGAGAVVEAGATVGANAVIGSNAVVGANATIGEDVVLHAGAIVLERCEVGARSIVHAGAVIGSDGFGYAPDADGHRHKIPQVGVVILEDDVEIGANTTIDRATFGETRIGRGTKIDNQVQIAHNVTLGEDCVVVSQSGIAGSTRVGNRLIMGAQTGMVGHLEVTDDVVVGARGALGQSVDQAGIYSGAPAIPHRQWLRSVAVQQRLPQLRKRVRELEARLAQVIAEHNAPANVARSEVED